MAATFSFLTTLSTTHSCVFLLNDLYTLAKLPAPTIWRRSKSWIRILSSSTCGFESDNLLRQECESAAVLDSSSKGLFWLGTPVYGSCSKSMACCSWLYYFVVRTRSLLNLTFDDALLLSTPWLYVSFTLVWFDSFFLPFDSVIFTWFFRPFNSVILILLFF